MRSTYFYRNAGLLWSTAEHTAVVVDKLRLVEIPQKPLFRYYVFVVKWLVPHTHAVFHNNC